MQKYYTRPCNFYYGSHAKKLVDNKKALSLAGNPKISFDQIEISTLAAGNSVSSQGVKFDWSKAAHVRAGMSGAISIDHPKNSDLGVQEFSMKTQNARGIFYRTLVLRIYPRYRLCNLLG